MSEQQPQPVDLAQELRELGEQIKKAFAVAREHPKTKEVEQQITKALRDIEVELQRAVKSAQEHEQIKHAGEQVKQTAQSVKESGAIDDIVSGIAKGVRALNEQIRKAVEEAEKTAQKPDDKP
jgi:hypothetical protein